MSTTISKLPRVLRAEVGPKVLAKASELFDQHLSTVLNELLQNCRRASATQVTITMLPLTAESTHVSIADDGEGIDDPQKLLTFGDSGWSAETDLCENAAGMGFASVASRGCVVESRNWNVRLEPDAFLGKSEAVVREGASIVGTRVTFIEAAAERYVADAIASAVRYYPLQVTVNGVPATQEDFLKDAVFVKETLGVRIGVKRGNGHHYTETLNFHGLCVGSGAIAEIRYPLDPMRSFYAIVDVIAAPQLRLVLPTRQSIIKDAYYEQIKAAAYFAILEHCATLPGILAFEDFQTGRTAGIPLPDPIPVLMQWQPCDLDGNPLASGSGKLELLPADRSGLAVTETSRGADAVNLAHACNRLAEKPLLLLASESKFTGYPWYDALPRVTDISYEIVTGEAVTQVYCDDMPLDTPPEADELRILVTSVRCKTVLFPVRIPAAALALNESVYESQFIVSSTLEPDVDDVLDLLMDAQFSFNDEGDTYDTQHNDASEYLRPLIIKRMLSNEDAIVEAMRKSLQDAVYEMQQLVQSVVIEYRTATITFKDGATRCIGL